jgi:hypothetical protein
VAIESLCYSGGITQKIDGLEKQVDKVDGRITRIEGIFMSNAPIFAKDVIKRFFHGEQEE